MEDLELLAGLHAVAAALLANGMPRRALPVLAVLKHLATDVARDAPHSVAADALGVDALTQLGQLDHATRLVGASLAAVDVPHDALELPHTAAEAAAPPLAPPAPTPPFRIDLPPDAASNAPAVRFLVDAAPSAHLAPLASEPVLHLLTLARVRLLLKLTERVPPSAVGAIAADAAGGGGGGGGGGGEVVGASEILRAAEALLGTVTPIGGGGGGGGERGGGGDDAADGGAPAAEAAPSSPAVQAANFVLSCEVGLLRSVVAARRGVPSAAIEAIKEAMGQAFPQLPWDGLESVAEGSVATLLPSLQPGALQWLRMRVALATLCLQQGQLAAAEEQIDTGRTEVNRAHDKRMLRALLLVHARVRVEQGQLSAAADEYKLWLDDAAGAIEPDRLAVATAAMEYATTLLSLSAGVGAVGGGPGAGKIVELLRAAESSLREEAYAQGMLSTEKWPCLTQPTPGLQPDAIGGGGGCRRRRRRGRRGRGARRRGVAAQPLPRAAPAARRGDVQARRRRAAHEPRRRRGADGDGRGGRRGGGAPVGGEDDRRAHPPPAPAARRARPLRARPHAPAAGRARGRAAPRGAAPAAWAAARRRPPGADGAPAPAAVGATPALAVGASVALQSALTALADGAVVDPSLQGQCLLELAMLHGARLTPGADGLSLYRAAAYLHLASAASASRRAVFVELPGGPAAALDAATPLPLPIEEEVTQAAGLSALRDNTMADLASEGRGSCAISSGSPRRSSARELPKPDQDAFERRLLLLTGYLKAACKPFADALAPPPPPAGELTLAVPPGFACLQWYETSSGLGGAAIEPEVTLLYLVATPAAAEGGGEEALPAGPAVGHARGRARDVAPAAEGPRRRAGGAL